MTTTLKKKRATKKKAAAGSGKSRVAEKYTVAIGDLVVIIEADKDGGYLVTCPFDPELYTYGRTLDEAVMMAKDARKTLAEARAKKPTPPRTKRSSSKTIQ